MIPRTAAKRFAATLPTDPQSRLHGCAGMDQPRLIAR
jgi:hypothetical protein